jgi:hypothetical protein
MDIYSCVLLSLLFYYKDRFISDFIPSLQAAIYTSVVFSAIQSSTMLPVTDWVIALKLELRQHKLRSCLLLIT